MTQQFRNYLSEQDARDYSDMQDQQETERYIRERQDDMQIAAAMAQHREASHQRQQQQRAAALAEALPATASRAFGRSAAITGAEYSQRADYLRMNGQEALELLDQQEEAAGRRHA